MAKVGPAIQPRSDVRPAPFSGFRPTLTTVPGGRSSERPAALTKLGARGSWLIMLAAGVAAWTGVIYGFLSTLTNSFN
jgi:hypothetical protein